MAAARALPLAGLRDTCARTKAAAEPDDEARHAAIHRSRFLRRRRTVDGAGELHYRSTPEEVAEIFGVVKGWAERRFHAARKAGRHEPGEAYLADGLLDAVRASQVHTGGGATGGSGGGRAPAVLRPAVALLATLLPAVLRLGRRPTTRPPARARMARLERTSAIRRTRRSRSQGVASCSPAWPRRRSRLRAVERGRPDRRAR